MKLSVKTRYWIDNYNKTFLGKGKVTLLKGIRDTSSLSKSSREIKMSYKAAWDSINASNKLANTTLTNTQSGGKGGGGSKITKEGLKAIETYDNLHLLEKLISSKLNATSLEELNEKIKDLTLTIEQYS